MSDDNTRNWQVHRRPLSAAEAVHWTAEALYRVNSRQVRGDDDGAARWTELADIYLQIAEAGGGHLNLLYVPPSRGQPADWQVVNAGEDGSQVDGTRPHCCPDTCPCRFLPLVPSRTILALPTPIIVGPGEG